MHIAKRFDLGQMRLNLLALKEPLLLEYDKKLSSGEFFEVEKSSMDIKLPQQMYSNDDVRKDLGTPSGGHHPHHQNK